MAAATAADTVADHWSTPLLAVLGVVLGVAVLLATYTLLMSYFVSRLLIVPPHYTPRKPEQGLPMKGALPRGSSRLDNHAAR